LATGKSKKMKFVGFSAMGLPFAAQTAQWMA
jgi:hypothetical protein